MVMLCRFERSPSSLTTSLVRWDHGELVGGLHETADLPLASSVQADPLISQPMGTAGIWVSSEPSPGSWLLQISTPSTATVRLTGLGGTHSYPELAAVQPDGVSVYEEHLCECRCASVTDARPHHGVALHGYRIGEPALGALWHWVFAATDDGTAVVNIYRTSDADGRRRTGGWVRIDGVHQRVEEVERDPGNELAVDLRIGDRRVRFETQPDGQALLATPYKGVQYTVQQQPVRVWIDGRPGYGVDEEARQA